MNANAIASVVAVAAVVVIVVRPLKRGIDLFVNNIIYG